MEALVFVLASLIVLSGGLLALGMILKKPNVKDWMHRKCNSFGYNNEEGEFISLSPLHPNSICYIRAVLAWTGIAFYYYGYQYLGIEIYLVAVFLDAVDGMVARACDLVTEKGEKIDPLFDKLTYLIPVIILFPDLKSTYFFLFFETVGQFLIRKILAKQGRSGAANNFGKIKALFAFALLPYMFVVEHYQIIPSIGSYLMLICAVLSACSAIFKLIPNRFYADILSMLNLACGAVGIALILNGNLVGSALTILLGQGFDLFDGRMALKHGGTKAGPWLDDLADSVSFGFCPTLMVWEMGDSFMIKGIAIIFLFSIIVRLLRFVTIDKKRKDHRDYIFFGLPSPAGAAAVMGVCLISKDLWIIGLVTAVIILLSVSSYKFIHLGRGIAKKLPRPTTIIGSAMLLVSLAYLVKTNSQVGVGYFLSMGTLLYIMMSEIAKRSIVKC